MDPSEKHVARGKGGKRATRDSKEESTIGHKRTWDVDVDRRRKPSFPKSITVVGSQSDVASIFCFAQGDHDFGPSVQGANMVNLPCQDKISLGEESLSRSRTIHAVAKLGVEQCNYFRKLTSTLPYSTTMKYHRPLHYAWTYLPKFHFEARFVVLLAVGHASPSTPHQNLSPRHEHLLDVIAIRAFKYHSVVMFVDRVLGHSRATTGALDSQ